MSDGEGCSHGPHVFYESKAEDLHARYPFSLLQPGADTSTTLDVAAIDCEMIYTTGGMRVARVSVVDGSGKEVYDQLVRMDPGVEVMYVVNSLAFSNTHFSSDYITRFSGITAEIHAKAVLPLASIRKTLDSLINADTILIGHALDNDLKTLRIIHHKCVDTALLFPHRSGPPYRRALRDL
jgi:RNA exonuclease 1